MLRIKSPVKYNKQKLIQKLIYFLGINDTWKQNKPSH